MADFLEWLIKGSDRHKVSEFPGGYKIMARDASRDALIAFQPIADDVLEHEGLGYEVDESHTSDRWGVPERDVAYDLITILVSEEQ